MRVGCVREIGLIKVAVCNVAQLLRGENIQVQDQADIQGKLKIPEYQRPYIWNVEQLDELITDIEEHQKKAKGSAILLRQYYLTCQDTELNIIDGQKGLTSLQIPLAI